MRAYITLAIFITIAIFSYWLRQDVTQEIETKEMTDAHFPDYFMENFVITNLDEQGKIAYRLKAVKMQHYADDDSAELEKPFLSLNKDNNEITLRAQRAVFIEKDGILTLYDDVVILRKQSANVSRLIIYTERLTVNTQTQIAETDLPAHIETDNAKLNSIGLIIDNKSATLLLKSNVNGTYNAAN